MKKVKSMNCNIDRPTEIYSEHSIYELTEEEMEKTGAQKYLVDRTFGNYAMKNMEHIELIEHAKRKSEYVYGVAFANTIEEAELAYKNAVLMCVVEDLENEIESIKSIFNKAVNFTINKIEFEVN